MKAAENRFLQNTVELDNLEYFPISKVWFMLEALLDPAN